MLCRKSFTGFSMPIVAFVENSDKNVKFFFYVKTIVPYTEAVHVTHSSQVKEGTTHSQLLQDQEKRLTAIVCEANNCVFVMKARIDSVTEVNTTDIESFEMAIQQTFTLEPKASS